VIAVGNCACSMEMFGKSYNQMKCLDEVTEVHAYLAGCPPKPEAMIQGVVALIQAQLAALKK
jgi:NADH:ubiquinone oxidoreductase subunit B-like Fe-S oxidoreductase